MKILKILEKEKKNKKIKYSEIAKILGISRQDFNYHRNNLKKNKITFNIEQIKLIYKFFWIIFLQKYRKYRRLNGKNNLKEVEKYNTKELHDELIKRGGVDTYFIEPYQKIEVVLQNEKIQIEGPTTILVIAD